MQDKIILLLLVILFIIVAALLMKLGYEYIAGKVIGGTRSIMYRGGAGHRASHPDFHLNISAGSEAEEYEDYSGGFDGGKKKKKGKGPNSLYVRKEWLDFVESGKKTIEGRKCYQRFLDWKVGDEIILWNDEDGEKEIKVKIKAVHKFDNIDKFLDKIDYKKALPSAKSVEDAKNIYLTWNKPETVDKYGFCAIEFTKVK